MSATVSEMPNRGRYDVRPTARRDIHQIADYMATKHRAAGRRFYDACEDAFQRLAQMPGLGQPYEVANPRLAGLRCWAVPRFKNHLIFYRPIEGGIEVIRILHEARGIGAILNPGDASPDAEADAPGLP